MSAYSIAAAINNLQAKVANCSSDTASNLGVTGRSGCVTN